MFCSVYGNKESVVGNSKCNEQELIDTRRTDDENGSTGDNKCTTIVLVVTHARMCAHTWVWVIGVNT